MKTIAIIGSSGALGSAFTERVSELYPNAAVHAFSRQDPHIQLRGVNYHCMDYQEEDAIEAAAASATSGKPLDMVIIATGLLHEENMRPEKSLRELSARKFQRLFEVNTVIPALIAKHFLPRLNTDTTSFFGFLSARAGSISDNQMGGWYAYRAAKAALNMVIKNAAIEILTPEQSGRFFDWDGQEVLP